VSSGTFSSEDRALPELRRLIDEVDDSILELLDRRAELAAEEARVIGTPRRDEARESSTLHRLRYRARRFPRRAVDLVWSAIFGACSSV